MSQKFVAKNGRLSVGGMLGGGGGNDGGGDRGGLGGGDGGLGGGDGGGGARGVRSSARYHVVQSLS